MNRKTTDRTPIFTPSNDLNDNPTDISTPADNPAAGSTLVAEWRPDQVEEDFRILEPVQLNKDGQLKIRGQVKLRVWSDPETIEKDSQSLEVRAKLEEAAPCLGSTSLIDWNDNTWNFCFQLNRPFESGEELGMAADLLDKDGNELRGIRGNILFKDSI